MVIDSNELGDLALVVALIFFGMVLIGAIIVGLATRQLARAARKRGRRGGRVAAFFVAVGSLVFIRTALIAWHNAALAGTRWFVGSGLVVGVAGSRLLNAVPARDDAESMQPHVQESAET